MTGWLVLLPVTLVVACSRAETVPAHPLAGRWAGAITHRGAELPTIIDLAYNDSVSGVVALSDGLSYQTRITRVRLEGSRLTWDAAGLGGRARFSGRLAGDTIAGTVDIGRLRANLHLVRSGEVPPPAWSLAEVRVPGGSADVTLAGTLLTPNTEGPHPAVILLSGSGEAPRAGLWPFAEAFARSGIAALIYDKRGDGQSTGNWRTSPFLALAEDGAAAVRWLRAYPGIDAERVGLWGASEGAYLVPATAKQAGGIAFAILASMPVVTPAEQDLVRIAREMRAYGYGETHIAEAVSLRKAAHAFIRTGDGADDLEERIRRLSAERWFRGTGWGITQPGSDYWWQWYGTKMDYDPAPLLAELQIPVLALYGGNDLVVESERNAGLLSAIIPATLLSVRHFPGADHSLSLPAGEREDVGGRWDWNRAGPGAVDTMNAWVRRIISP